MYIFNMDFSRLLLHFLALVLLDLEMLSTLVVAVATGMSLATETSSSPTDTLDPPTSYAEVATYHHNIHRSNHSADPLEWDESLASCAAEIASSCIYAHNLETQSGGYGQNIAAGFEGYNISAIITNLFYNDEVNVFEGHHNQSSPDMSDFEQWGHFSQVVWKGSSKLGCATHDCSNQGLANVGSTVPPFFTVCNYKSPGNYKGQYARNVGGPLKMATVHWDAGLSSG